MKKISIMVPCYNEEENVVPLSEALIDMFAKDLPKYDYEILFIDNDSTDTTRVKLRQLCKNNPKIKAIFNAKNFGQFNSPYYGILRQQVTVLYLYAQTFRTLSMLSQDLLQSGRKDIRLCVQ
mgnify:CR=1 FL=1